MTNTTGIPGDRICSFIERVEHIDEEIKTLNEGKKEVFAEAKGEGFDVGVLKEILRLRKSQGTAFASSIHGQGSLPLTMRISRSAIACSAR